MATNSIKLSILICSVDIDERQINLKKIINELNNQISKNYAENIVEVIIEKDDGTMSVGEKRNLLISKANGEYVCFIDDDDFISKNYLNLILQRLEKDILMIRIAHLIDGFKVKSIQTSLFIEFFETNDVVFRANYFHLCPVKKEIANLVKYPKINFAENYEYSQRIIQLVKCYDIVEEEIYIYNDIMSKSLTRNV
jgi:transcriptional regulator CtsR